MDGIGSLHSSAGGSFALASMVQFAESSSSCKFAACLAVLSAVQWWLDVGALRLLTLLGCGLKGIPGDGHAPVSLLEAFGW